MDNILKLLDKENLGGLLDNFSKATGIYIDAVNMQGETLIKHRVCQISNFCKQIKKSENGECKCKNSYKRATIECGKWSEPYFFRCHAGLVIWSAPIIIDKKQLGAIICGQVLLWKPDRFFFKELEQFNKNIYEFEKLKENVMDINVISPDRSKSIASMMSMFVNYLANSYNKIFINEKEILEWRNCILNELKTRKKEYKNYKFDNSVYLKREKSLLQHIRTGNKKEIKKLLPKVFSDIEILSEFDCDTVRVYCVELMIMISRAAIDGGIDSDICINISRKFNVEVNNLKNFEEIFNKLNTTILTLLDMIYILGNNNQNNILKNARDYIEHNYNKKISIIDIANSIYISQYYLSHLFKQNLNMTINEYITRVRIEKSIELMKKREFSINDIMKMVGFNS
ncbi:MAG: hypothetical protein Q606_CBAC00018G0001, partial [Intestinibacter bartlettii DORA_8_9]